MLVPEKKGSQTYKNPFEMLFNTQNQTDEQEKQTNSNHDLKQKRAQIRKLLELGELEDQRITVEIEEQQNMFELFQGTGMEQMGINVQDMFRNPYAKENEKTKTNGSRSKKGFNATRSSKTYRHG